MPRQERQNIGIAVFIAGLIFLLISLGASLMLVLEHLVGMGLPGCGTGTDCAKAAAGPFGKVPGLGWPTSSVGLAYFIGLTAAWVFTRGRIGQPLRWIVRLGEAVSIMLVAVLIVETHFCPYCIVVHVGNFGFWIVGEITGWAALRSYKPSTAARAVASTPADMTFFLPSMLFGGFFAAALVLLVGAEFWNKEAIAAREAGELDESTQRIIERSGSPLRGSEGDELSKDQQAQDEARGDGEGFTGRWRLGPEVAPIRIVIFSDYQCDDCRKIEDQARLLAAQRDDVSLSAKHFPFSTLCNKYISIDMHPNACWAARAAETAGILRGNEGFWQMHHWLFDRKGSFTDEEILTALPQMGYNVNEFVQIMAGPQSLAPVEQDIDEAVQLGIHFTPMVFINGQELRGYRTPSALVQAVERLAATNPPPRSPSHDHPDRSADKHVADWRAWPVQLNAMLRRKWSIGAEDPQARVKIVVWSDYQSPATAALDRAVRAAMKDRDDVQYMLRHFPADQSCNPYAQLSPHPFGCNASRAAEAAGVIGGERAYLAMHDWLLANQKPLDDAALEQAAAAVELDLQQLLEAMKSSEVIAAVNQDIQAGRNMIMQGLPALYINGKWVPRWHLRGHNILERIIEEAAGD